MKQKIYGMTAGTIFLVVSALHFIRAYYSWPVIINAEWIIPVWFSWVAAAVALVLSATSYSLGVKDPHADRSKSNENQSY